MKGFGQRLRDRARKLGLADTAVAQRLGLSQQRYFNYVADQTEPDFEMLLRICQALDTTPNAVFGIDSTRPPQDEADILLARIMAAARTMTVPTLRITAAVVGVLAEVREPEVALRSEEQGRKAENRPSDAAPT